MLVQICLLTLVIALAIPCAVFFVECLSAAVGSSSQTPSSLAPSSPTPSASDLKSFSIAVLMPAHNEAEVIASTLAALTPQLSGQDKLIVVADNCTDQTAQLARQAGASVLERTDDSRRGKGYALDYGLQSIAAAPPAVVVIVDADCRFERGSLRQLAQTALAQQRPVQAVYLLEQVEQPSLKESVSAFAFKVKNLVRPLGLMRLNLPCLLTGTGMAFPWPIVAKIDLASSSIVEDMKLGFDLAIAHNPPLLCPAVNVVGPLPPTDEAAKTQRTRWEHGHLQLISRYVPRLVTQAAVQGRLGLLAIALDLLVPPLSLLVMLGLAITALTTLAGAVTGFWLSAQICYGALLAILAAVILSWAKFAQADISLKKLLSVPLYLLWKVPLYLKFLTNPQVEWVRTRRQSVRK
jgi:cellulose synthase/poly-beta-1,6-N-acetylglucosamine synthase-like glycosyltransferase